MKRLIVPLDGFRSGKRTLPWTLLLARRSEARLDLVHVGRGS